MRVLHYIEIENFKGFGEKQRIELDHPTVLIGPNNCGKTTALQAIALWAQAVKTWYDQRHASTAKERTAVGLNRLAIVAVPVQRTRFFWRGARTRAGNNDIHVVLTAGVPWRDDEARPLRMRFRNQGEELVYANPELSGAPDDLEFIAHVAKTVSVHLLYSMSGLEIEEPVLTPGRIDVLLGQGQTAQVLRNLCLLVHDRAPNDWEQVTRWMERLFDVRLGVPTQNVRGSIELTYQQGDTKEPLDLSLAGRGFLQMLLILSYLFSHRGGILLVDEPDAHFEILRQRQVYVLLREIAAETSSQVVMVTHSEVLLEEAIDRNLTLILDSRVEPLSSKTSIANSLKHFGTSHYLKARARRHVLYLEGTTDLDLLRKLAERLDHHVLSVWDDRANVYYVQDQYPTREAPAELERVEGGYGIEPPKHFFAIRGMVPDLRGLALLDGDGRKRTDSYEGGLRIAYWRRYEIENYVVTPDILRDAALGILSTQSSLLPQGDLFADTWRKTIDEILAALTRDKVFVEPEEYEIYRNADEDPRRLLWAQATAMVKLSAFAEEFFKRLAKAVQQPIAMRKGEFHRLVAFADPQQIAGEVREKLDLLYELWTRDGQRT